jgi:Fimbrial assembly protein (PilN)
MRKEDLNLPVIEWSASTVTLYDPQTRQYHAGSSVKELVPFMGSAKKAVVTLSRRSSFVRTLRVPDATKAQVAQVIQLQLPGILPIPAGDIAFDFRLAKDSSSEGRMAIVGAVSANTLKQILLEFKALGIEPTVVVPVAFGSWLLSQSLDLTQCAVVEHVTEGLAIDVIADGDLRYTRVVPFPKGSEAIEAEVCRTFSVAKVPCSHIVAAAGLSFEGADTTVATRTLDVFGSGFLTRLDINIELPDTVDTRRKKSLYVRGRTAVVLWVAAVVLGLFLLQSRSDMAASVAAGMAHYNSSSKQLNTILSSTKSKATSEEDLQKTLLTAFQPAQNPSDVISALSKWIDPKKMWIGGITFERGKALLMRGTAMDSDTVAAYVQDLAIDPRFRDVKLVFANNGTVENKPVVEFSVEAHVMGNIPVSTTGAH